MGKKADQTKAVKGAAPTPPATKIQPSPNAPVRSPESGPQTIAEHLLAPWNLDVFRYLRDGGTITFSATETVPIQWSARISERLVSWLKTGDMSQLANLVREDPWIIVHPVVYNQVFHLRRLQRLPDWADIEEGAIIVNSEDDPAPAGTRQAAREALQSLTSAWVQGVLGGAWTLKSPPKRRGRKISSDDMSFNFLLLDQYEQVLGHLKKEKQIRRRTGERDDQWKARLCAIIREVWNTSLGWEDDVQVPVGGDLVDRLSNSVIKPKRLPLPEDRIKKWADKVMEVSREGPIRDRIAYHLLAYRWDVKANQVRWGIQAARKFDK